MPKETAIDLSFVNNKELQDELVKRYEEIIIIREDYKDEEHFYIRAKTGFGSSGKPEVGFDIVVALNMLADTQKTLIAEHFGLEPVKDDGSDTPQDAD